MRWLRALFGRWRRRRAEKRRQIAVTSIPADLPQRLAAFVNAEAAKLGLVVVGEGSGAGWVSQPGKLMEMHAGWYDAPAGEQAVYDMALVLLRGIVRTYGPGRVWSAPNLALIYPVYDDGALVRLNGETPAIRLRAHYYHEASARPIAPPDPEAA